VNELFSGKGWQVCDVICSAGPDDRPYEERHETVCVAMVTQGTFRYRAEQGSAMLAPGAILLGNHRSCYECGHEHGAGDRCLSFHFQPAYFEAVAAEIRTIRSIGFGAASLPPVAVLAPLLAEAEAARDAAETAEMEEIGLRLAGAVIATAAGVAGRQSEPGVRDQKRVSEAIRLIETEAERPISLDELADASATSRYHFLRIFRAVAGMTPYQYVLRTRLHRAAIRLRNGDEPVSTIALEAGFNDLSTFNRRFRRVMGVTPLAYRAA
jgi:AraC-like DNA-binding protein